VTRASLRRAPFSILLLVVVSAAGCAADPISPSHVTRLRILGLRPEPAEPLPGDSLSLDLLWTDTPKSCTQDTPCPTGQSCQSGACVRDDDTVQIVWLVSRLSAWQATDTTATNGSFTDLLTSGVDVPGLGQCTFDQASCSLSCEGFGDLSLWDLCSMGCQGLPGGDIAICCGGPAASHFDVSVPTDIEVPQPTCGGDTSIDLSQILQVQAQVCVGGEINLCDLDVASLSFGCEGEGAETVNAISRVNIADNADNANHGPSILGPLWGRTEARDVVHWTPDVDIVVEGCLDSDCATRACGQQADCSRICEGGSCPTSGYFDADSPARIDAPADSMRGPTTCYNDRCREELSVALTEAAQETYLRACDEETACAQDTDCASNFVCHEGTCRRIENPVTAFYTTDGLFNPGRVVLDTDGDGRPNDDRFRTHWIPPVLDECSSDADCYLGECDDQTGRCTREISFWVVSRDGRGGQDWIERTIRVVPPRL